MLSTDKAVIVEGKYDKAHLSSVTDALIITTGGFKIFNSREKQKFIKKLAEEKGLLILTDSDAAGFKIRNFLKNIVSEDRLTNAYIPDIYGREKRKNSPSKEGKLGVEGIDTDKLRAALERSGVFSENKKSEKRKLITTADLYEAGLTGKKNSAEKRRKFLVSQDLPARLTGKSMLTVLNSFFTYEEFNSRLAELFSD